MIRMLIIFLFALASSAHADLREHITKMKLPNERVIKVTGHPDYPPVVWQDPKTGKLMGIAVELVETILKEVNVKAEFSRSDTWGRAQEEVRTGRVDMLLPPYLTDERARSYVFSKEPFLIDETAIFVPKGKSFPYRDFADLAKLHGVAIIDDSFGEAFDRYEKKNLKLHRLAKTAQCLEFLLSGRAQYMIAGYYSGLAVANRMDAEEKIEILPKRVIVTSMYAPVSRKSPWNIPDLQKYFNQRMRELRENGTIEKLKLHYLSVYKKG